MSCTADKFWHFLDILKRNIILPDEVPNKQEVQNILDVLLCNNVERKTEYNNFLDTKFTQASEWNIINEYLEKCFALINSQIICTAFIELLSSIDINEEFETYWNSQNGVNNMYYQNISMHKLFKYFDSNSHEIDDLRYISFPFNDYTMNKPHDDLDKTVGNLALFIDTNKNGIKMFQIKVFHYQSDFEYEAIIGEIPFEQVKNVFM